MASLDPVLLARAFDVGARLVDDGHAPWTVLGVATRDRVLRVEAYGEAGGRRVGTGAVAAIASITKPVVATTILQLAAEGRLSLVEPLERLLPAAAEAAAETGAPPITPWHLLTHTAGLADLDREDLLGRGITHDEVVHRLLREPRRSGPGAAFAYATCTFDLLAALLAHVDGVPYPDALRARVLDPLGMHDTTFDPRETHRDRMIPPLAAPLPDGGAVPEAVLDAFIGLAMPGAGLWSTASDLLRFGRAFLRGGELDGARILPRPFVELMTREVTVDGLGATGDPTTADRYALGWGKPGPGDAASPSAFSHGGLSGTRLLVDPERDLVVAYLTGAWNQPSWIADRVMNAVLAAVR